MSFGSYVDDVNLLGDNINARKNNKFWKELIASSNCLHIEKLI
jgi:hypothetical protein